MSDDDIVEELMECAADSRAVEGDYYADQFSTDPEIFERAAAEITRLRSGASAARETVRLTADERKVLTATLLSEIGTVQKYNSLVFDLQAEIARLRLRPEERVAIEQAASFLEGSGWSGKTLRGILARLHEDKDAL